ncbi:tetratricopeptide repeat protein [Stieleria sp. TO1_6]|uniref:tetratricopeptide repeat protein n=1 Tax=Stieleria tagensis TaxID=2956795 RepID=UPI00209B0A78|nr:tetratricopeptide repeat protein [Stieleria tagensis]MCO8123010.1 tetratricopeptide repeat protein [Stieleria tagensis]
MKDRQEQLEQNLVAENLASVFKKVEPYSKLILAGVVAVVVALVGIGLYTSGQTAKRADATLQLLMENPEVASQYPDTVAAAWSLLFQGNDSLAQGINSLYQDRDEAETLLGQAKEQFTSARGASKDTILVSRANFGLAMAAESLGEVEEAKQAYQGTVDANESEQMVEIAKQRIARLANPQSDEFLAWFSEQDFSPADPSLPPELPGASGLPDLPDLELPDLDLGDNLKASDQPQDAVEGGLELPEDAQAGNEAEMNAEPAADSSESTDQPAEPAAATDAEPSETPADGASKTSDEAAEPTGSTNEESADDSNSEASQ